LNGQATENQIRLSYEKDMQAVANSPDRLSALLDERDMNIKINRAMNPAYDRIKGSSTGIYTQANYRKALSDTRAMLEYLKEKNGSLTPDEQAIESAITTYMYHSSLKKSIQGQTKEAKFERGRIDAILQSHYMVLKNQSANAALFIDAVLEGLAFDPIYVNAFGE